MSAWTVGFRSRDGIRMNLCVVVVDPSSLVTVTGTVSVAISSGVRVTPAGTTGFAESFRAEKSPVYSEGWGMVLDAIWVGATA